MNSVKNSKSLFWKTCEVALTENTNFVIADHTQVNKDGRIWPIVNSLVQVTFQQVILTITETFSDYLDTSNTNNITTYMLLIS